MIRINVDPQRTTNLMNKPSVLASAVGCALASMGAAAQELAADDGIDTVIVEATALPGESSSAKFTAPLVDTPKSVVVLPAGLLEEQGAASLVDALRNVPGITFNAGEGGQPAGDNLKIRGFDAGADVFIDGVRDGGSQTRDIFALEQIEVVKGPGSAYTGRGSTGGAVNLVTKKPQAEAFTRAQLGAGTAEQSRATLDGNYVFGDSAAFRVNALVQDGNMPGREAVSLAHRGFAPSLALGVDAPTRVDLSYYYYTTDDIPDYSIPYGRNADDTAAEGEPALVDRADFYGLLDRDFQRTGASIGSVGIEHRIGPNLRVRNASRRGVTSNDYIVTNPDDSRGNVPNGFVLRNTKSRNSETTTTANQTDLIGHFGLGRTRHSFVAGLELSREEMANRNYVVETTFSGNAVTSFDDSCSAPGAVGAASSYNCTTLADPNPFDPWTGSITPAPSATLAKTDTQSVYFLDTVDLREHWSVNLGLRYDDYSTQQWSGPADSPVQLGNDSAFLNHQLGLVFKPAANSTLYISTGTSSNPSGNTLGDGTENIAASQEDLTPERNRTYELGTKWQLGGGRVGVTSALFHTVKSNARVAVEPGRGAAQQTIGAQTVDGFELGVTGAVTRRLHLVANVTLLKSEITDDGPIETNEGNEFPNTPRRSASLWATYAFGQRATVGGGATFVDKRYGNTANTVWVPAYTTYDAMAAVELSDRLGLRLNLKNLTDEVYFTRPYAAHYAAIGAGRSAVVSVDLRF
jgi:catecholate siderophore receptor